MKLMKKWLDGLASFVGADLIEYGNECDHQLPTEDGHDLWSESVISFFTP
jgi:hypothetical protein